MDLKHQRDSEYTAVMEETMSTPETQDEPARREIRTDMWGCMNHQQLIMQRELLMDKITTVQQLIGMSASPSTLMMYNALQLGLNDINQLIDKHASTKKRRV